MRPATAATLIATTSDLGGRAINYEALLILSLVIGFGGSFISLAVSKWMAKRATGARVIERPSNATESWLVSTVQRLSQQAGIDMPEVAIYDSVAKRKFFDIFRHLQYMGCTS